MKKFTFLLVFISVIGFGQNQINIDSLETAFNIETKASKKIKLWNTLFRHYLNSDYKKASFYNGLLLKYAESTQNDSAFFNSKMYEAYVYRLKGEQDSAIALANEAKVYALKIPNDHYLKTYHTLLSTVYIFKDEPEIALFHIEKNMEISKTLKDTLGVADAYFTKGHFHGRYNDTALSLQNYIIADSIYSLSKIPDANHASALSNIGTIFIEQDDPNSAEKYFIKASEIYNASNNIYGKNMISIRFAEMYLLQKEFKKTRAMADKAMPFFKENNIKFRIINLNNIIGTTYLLENKNKRALEYFKEAEKLSLEIKDSSMISTSYFNLAQTYFADKQLNIAEPFYLNALRIAQASHDLNRSKEITTDLSELYEKDNQPNNALKYLRLYQTLNDSLQQKQHKETFFDLEKKYQTKKKEQEIALLTTQNTLAEKQKSNQRNIFIAAFAVVSIAGLFFFFQYRNRQKTNKKLRELDAAKSTFFTNISHDFRTPLTLIKGPLEDQLEDASLSFSKRKNLKAAYRNTERLENLVGQLMSLSKLNSSTMPLLVQPVAIDSFLHLYTEGFQYQSDEQGLQFSLITKINEDVHWLDQDVISKILYNLLGNALKYTSENGQIIVNGNTKNGYFNLKVYNSCTALSEKEKELIFTRFFQTNNTNPGTGIGLSLIKQLVLLHKGTISVENENEGIVFIVKIPTEKAAYNQEEILSETLHSITSETEIDEVSQLLEIDDDAPVLLVVDDAKDIRDYVQSIFQEEFKVLTAANGEEALSLAIEHIPDIIISDVVMPKMDGYALTKQSKENPLTSHIPIILLTAKNKEVDQLEAMGYGADAYTTKPFSPKLLKANVANLIENRRKLQERFSQELILTPKEIAVTSADEEFLTRLQETLDEYITQPDFTAAKFSEVMLMNRMQLHRKLKALTGLSSSEFIKNQRLRLAAQLIKTKDLNISEVGYSIGFNDPSYFAKCFKQEFGVSPKEFALKNRE